MLFDIGYWILFTIDAILFLGMKKYFLGSFHSSFFEFCFVYLDGGVLNLFQSTSKLINNRNERKWNEYYGLGDLSSLHIWVHILYLDVNAKHIT